MPSSHHLTLEQKVAFVHLLTTSTATMAEACRAFRICREGATNGGDVINITAGRGCASAPDVHAVRLRPPLRCGANGCGWRAAATNSGGQRKCSATCNESIPAHACLRSARWVACCVAIAGHSRNRHGGHDRSGSGRPVSGCAIATMCGRWISKVTFALRTGGAAIR